MYSFCTSKLPAILFIFFMVMNSSHKILIQGQSSTTTNMNNTNTAVITPNAINNSQNNNSSINNETISTTANTSNSNSINDGNNNCKKGNRVGAFLVLEPNSSSLIFPSFKDYLIRWSYTNWVTKRPQFVDIKIEKFSSEARGPPTWKAYLAQNVSIGNGATSFLWKPQDLVDGSYKIRLVGDGKENNVLNPSTNANDPASTVCFENGEAMPGVSALFKVATIRELASSPDRFGPLKSSATRPLFSSGTGFRFINQYIGIINDQSFIYKVSCSFLILLFK